MTQDTNIGNELYSKAINDCLLEHRELMAKVWSPTPWMLNVHIESEEMRRSIRNWCNQNLGAESSPIHGNNGNWHEGGCTIQSKTWFGFKTQEMMNRFRAQFHQPNNL